MLVCTMYRGLHGLPLKKCWLKIRDQQNVRGNHRLVKSYLAMLNLVNWP